ncbi:MAG TPA: helix-turn-helix transcriptional regulator [Candidatus Kryptonia bacterium]
MEPKERFNQLLDKFKDDPEFIFQGLILRVSEDIASLLKTQNMTRGKLAEKLNCSAAYVTKLLRGSENLTLKKLFEVSRALNAEFSVHMSARASAFDREDVECIFAEANFKLFKPREEADEHPVPNAA